MSVAVGRTTFLALSGTTAGRALLGAFPGALWVPTLRLQFLAPGTENITVSPVIVGTDSNNDANHASGRPLISGGASLSNGQPAFVVPVVNGGSIVVDIPVGRLPGSGPYWFLIRAVGDNGLTGSQVLASAMGVPFVGAVGARDRQVAALPGAGLMSGSLGGGSAPVGGGSGAV